MNSFKGDHILLLRHELRTPLTISQGYTELALEAVTRHLQDQTPLSQQEMVQLEKFLRQALDEHEHMTQLMDAMRKGVETPQLKDLVGFVKRVVAARGGLLPVRRLNYAENRGPQTAYVVFAESAIQQVLTNLLDNALRYSSPETPVVVLAEQVKNAIRISVVDQGIGIDNADLERIWEQGSRMLAAATISSEGTGTGLALVRHIIEQQRGRVGVQSNPGRGSSFWFELPLAEQA